MTERQPTDDSQGPAAKGQGPTAIDAPRPNHSTGPKTPEGKARCRLNAVRHGLTGQFVALTPEEGQAYEKHRNMVLDALAPVGDFERDIAQTIADGRWRLKRASAIEAGLFAGGNLQFRRSDTNHVPVDDSFAQSLTFADQAHNLQLLTIYEQRIQRSVDKNMLHLEALQTSRKELAEEAMQQAKLLYQLAQAQGKPYEPDAFFARNPELGESVFSTSEVALAVTHAKLLEDAKIYNLSRKLPE